MTALFVAGFPEWVATGPDPTDGYRHFTVSLHLRPAADVPPQSWLVEARLSLPYPDQRCTIGWSHAAALGIDLEPHYATDATGARFLPGSSFATVIGAGAPDPEATALHEAAAAGAALRDWQAALVAALDASGGAVAQTAWPPPPAALSRFACRYDADNLRALWQRRGSERHAAAESQAAASREQNADPIYMPHNWG